MDQQVHSMHKRSTTSPSSISITISTTIGSDWSQWIRENTQKDLTYLYGLGMSPLIQQEIAATEPIVIADRRGR